MLLSIRFTFFEKRFQKKIFKKVLEKDFCNGKICKN